MPTEDYRGISVKAEVYEKLEKLRARFGLRSIAEVVDYLATKTLTTKVEVKAR